MTTQTKNGIPEPISSKTVRAGSKTYFLDVKEAKNGNRYLQITESRLQNGQSFRSNIMIFPDHLAEFCQALDEAKEVIQK